VKPLRRLLNALALAALLASCAAPPAPEPSPPPAPTRAAAATAPARTTPAQPTAATPASPATTAAPPTATPLPRDPVFDPRRLSYAHNFALAEIQAYLDAHGSTLKDVRFQVGDRSMSFAHVLTGLSSLYSLNPQLLLALMELHAGLVSNPAPSADALGYAMGFRGEAGGRRGLYAQLRWAARELRHATRDYAERDAFPMPGWAFADGSRQDVAPDISLSRYVLGRVLAPTTSPCGLGPRMDALATTYERLFDEDPRRAPAGWPPPAQPFLRRPMEQTYEITSFFDHDAPFLRKSGSLLTFWGRSETDVSFAYDGHTGWDYAMAPPDIVLAAGDGTVVFAGNSDDGCASPARAVIVDHGNGYRTLYWHLARIDVEPGQPIAAGTPVGMAGESGCAVGAHLHLQVQYLGRDVDPYGWCGAAPDPWALSPAGQASVWLWADMPSPCGPPAPGTVVVDDGGPGFLSQGDWQRNEVGYAGGSRFAAGSFAGSAARPYLPADLDEPAVAAWRPELPRPGRYRVLAYIPYALNGLHDSRELRYLVRHSGGESLATVNAEESRNWWADLGTYEFDPAAGPLVSTSTLAGDDRRGVWADAIAFVPAE